jgi:hypothetical protein
MAKKKEEKKLTVKEIKELQPLAEVYELSKYRKYIVLVQKSPLIAMDSVTTETKARELGRVLQSAGVPCYMLIGIDSKDVRFLEIN